MLTSLLSKANEMNTLDLTDAQSIIAASTAKATAIGAIPIPVLDVVAITYIQVDMVKKLSKVYKVESDKWESLVLFTVVSNVLSRLLSGAISSSKLTASLQGLVSESLIKSTIAGAFTTVIGEIYNQHFLSGGTMDDFTIETFLHFLKEAIYHDVLGIER